MSRHFRLGTLMTCNLESNFCLCAADRSPSITECFAMIVLILVAL